MAEMVRITGLPYENGGRKRGALSAQSRRDVDAVNVVLNDLRDYWPLTLRQVYYQLVAKGILENTHAQAHT